MKKIIYLVIVFANLFISKTMYAQNTVPEKDRRGPSEDLYDTILSLNIINPILTKIKLVAKNAPQSNSLKPTRRTFKEMEFYKNNEPIPFGANHLTKKEQLEYVNDFISFTTFTFKDGLVIQYNNDDGEFSTFKLKNDTYYVKIGNNIIRIGDNIQILENFYPRSYQNFISQNNDYIEILTAPVNDYSVRSILFKFNPVTRLINKIILFDDAID